MRNVVLLAGLLSLLLLVVSAPLVAAETETLVLKVDGMTSACCEDVIRWVLFDKVDGVGDVDAEHEAGLVTIRFDPDQIALAAVVKKINETPSFRVTGSHSHTLDPSLLEKNTAQDRHGTDCAKSGCTKPKHAKKKPAKQP